MKLWFMNYCTANSLSLRFADRGADGIDDDRACARRLRPE